MAAITCQGPAPEPAPDAPPCPFNATGELGLAVRDGWRKSPGERWGCRACYSARITGEPPPEPPF